MECQELYVLETRISLSERSENGAPFRDEVAVIACECPVAGRRTSHVLTRAVDLDSLEVFEEGLQ